MAINAGHLGQPQAEQLLEVDGQLKLIAETVHLQGSGIPGTGVPIVTSAVPKTLGGLTTIHAGHIDLSVSRVLDLSGLTSGQKILTATWAEQNVPVQLASAVVV